MLQPILTDAQTFLAAALPWGPDWCNLHYTRKIEGDGKKSFVIPGMAYKSVSDMINGLKYFGGQPDITDFYVCMSSQLMANSTPNTKGRVTNKAMRTTQNATALKSLYVDVDVKKDKGYDTTAEALAAFTDFIKKYDLPSPSAIVASGSGGFHTHWIFDAPVARDDWFLLAHALSHTIREFGLRADTQCTVDAARLLRLPGTFNHKHEPPKPVSLLAPRHPEPVTLYSVDRLLRSLAPFVGLSTSPLAGTGVGVLPRKAPIAGGAEELGAGIEDGPTPDLDVVADKCPWIAETLATGGANNNQPLWFLTANIASFTQGAEMDFVRMSDGHPEFDMEEMVKTYDRVVAGKNGAGWVKCATINASGCTNCATCPLLVQGKSPLNFGMPQTGELLPPVRPHTTPAGDDGFGHLPHGFFYGSEGHVLFVGIDPVSEQPSNRQLCDYPLMNGWVEEEGNVLHFTTIISETVRRIRLPLDTIMGKDVFGKAIAKFGISINEFHVKETKEFMVAWVNKLQHVKEAVVVTSPFGWVYKPGEGDEIEGFSYGGKIWGANDHVRPAAIADGILAKQYAPTGLLDPWFEAARIITDQRRPALDVILAASFGAPLMSFLGQSGTLVSAYSSKSGIGKSTAMAVAMAVWGHPIEAMQSLDDTVASTMNKMGSLRMAPLFWDEMKGQENAERFTKMVFQLTQGREKNRANSDMTLRKAGTWQTMLISASNNSLVDPINEVVRDGGSGLYRLFEFEVLAGKTGQVATGMVQRKIDTLRRNYGQAGLLYAQFLGANSARVKHEVGEVHDLLNKTLAAGNEERFWTSSMAALIAGAKYANELGLTDIDVSSMYRFLIKVLEDMRAVVKGGVPLQTDSIESVRDLLATFITENAVRRTLITDTTNHTHGPMSKAVTVKTDISRIEELVVQRVTDDDLIMIRSVPFHTWLRQKKLPERATIRFMQNVMGVLKTRRVMGIGTVLQTPQDYCYILDLNHPTLRDLL